MIREYFGNLGTGKTFNMTYDTMWWLKRGLRVVTNYKIEFCTSNKPTNDTDHVLAEKKCKYGKKHCRSVFMPDPERFLYHMVHDVHTLFPIDEASIILPPRINIPRTFLHKFLQNRKDACHIYYTAQVPKYVYGMLRALTNETVRCSTHKLLNHFKKIPCIRYTGGKFVYQKVDAVFFTARWYDTNIIEKKMNFYDRKGKDRAWRTRTISPSDARPIFKAYDTLYKVDFSANFKMSKFSKPTKPTPNTALIAEAFDALQGVKDDLGSSEKYIN